jgi:hypothetical protein
MFRQEDLILPTWAKELGALVVTLEHRFIGYSKPNNASNLVERYRTLTVDNIIDDSVRFLNHIKTTVPGAKDSKVIVWGGSSTDINKWSSGELC